MLVSMWFPHGELHSAVTSSSPALVSSSSGDGNSPGSIHLSQNLNLLHLPASLWLKHDPWRVTTRYPLPIYPLAVYLYPQRAINPQVKVLPFSPINLPSWATLHRNSKVSAVVHLWDDKSHLIFSHNASNVLMISPILGWNSFSESHFAPLA